MGLTEPLPSAKWGSVKARTRSTALPLQRHRRGCESTTTALSLGLQFIPFIAGVAQRASLVPQGVELCFRCLPPSLLRNLLEDNCLADRRKCNTGKLQVRHSERDTDDR